MNSKPFTTAKTAFVCGFLKAKLIEIGLWMPPQEWIKKIERLITLGVFE